MGQLHRGRWPVPERGDTGVELDMVSYISDEFLKGFKKLLKMVKRT